MKKYSSERGNAFLGLLLIAGVIIFLMWYMRSDYAFFKDKPSDDPKFEEQMIAGGENYTIEITPQGFVPEHVKLSQYDTLTFVNKDIRAHRPISDPHPDHDQCLEIDSKRDLIQNDSVKIIFLKARTCGFHDEMNTSWNGEIVIEKLTKEEIKEREKVASSTPAK